MFFPKRIKSIQDSDLVLEIGPGSTPYHRSNVFLEMKWEDETIQKAQRGELKGNLNSEKTIVYYDGTVFPFQNHEFDYVICSHVIEHVPNVDLFLSELFRIAKKGYIEYPTIYFEFIYNINVHLNIQKFKDGCFFYMDKKDSNILGYAHMQFFFGEIIQKGYLKDLYNILSQYSIEGFEWDTKFKYEKTFSLEKLYNDNFDFIPNSPTESELIRIMRKLERFIS
jgi:ubiquinone/menaquinone biosynthesis C-methylase UbiE